ncbi:MAG TPA: hypothetical protein DDX14_02220, partial [Cyanobacteria bacterium UBA9579]|nr:hypothetical protein [Cyanobacteria bacterium UBA9579]
NVTPVPSFGSNVIVKKSVQKFGDRTVQIIGEALPEVKQIAQKENAKVIFKAFREGDFLRLGYKVRLKTLLPNKFFKLQELRVWKNAGTFLTKDAVIAAVKNSIERLKVFK